MVHQPTGKESTQSRWVEGSPQAVGEVGGWLHPKTEGCGWLSRLVVEVLGEGRGGLKGIPEVPLPCPSIDPQGS